MRRPSRHRIQTFKGILSILGYEARRSRKMGMPGWCLKDPTGLESFFAGEDEEDALLRGVLSAVIRLARNELQGETTPLTPSEVDEGPDRIDKALPT